MERASFRSRGFGLLASAVAVAALTAFPAAPAHAAVGCGDTVAVDHAVVALTENLLCSGAGIVVTADSVTIDLGGYTMRGDPSVVAVGIDVTGDGVTIVNGTIRDFDKNIVISRADRGRVADVTTRNGEAGVIAFHADNTIIERTSSRGHGEGAIVVTASNGVAIADVMVRGSGNGIFVIGSFGTSVLRADLRDCSAGIHAVSSNGTVITDSRISRNGAGVLSEDSTKTQVVESTIRRNDDGVRYTGVSDGGFVRDSRIVRNTVGIRIGGVGPPPVGPVFIQDNVIRRNGAAGILADLNGAGLNLQILRNRVNANGHAPSGVVDSLGDTVNDGIHVVGPADAVVGVTIGGNSTNRNYEFGIEADGATDGGGNTARRHGNPAECLGVSC